MIHWLRLQWCFSSLNEAVYRATQTSVSLTDAVQSFSCVNDQFSKIEIPLP